MRVLERLLGRRRDSSAFEKWKSLGDAEAIVARELAAWREAQAGPPPYRLLDIGGGDGAQLDDFLTPMGDAFSCESLDIDGPEEPGRIVFDICKPVPDRWHDRYPGRRLQVRLARFDCHHENLHLCQRCH